MNSFGSFIVKM